MLRLFRRSSTNRDVVERLYATIVAAARRPSLYSRHDVPDTFEGRFECLTLHAVLVVHHLRSEVEPGPELAQALVDAIFRHFDRTLREMGVGDTTVPKRMKTMAEAFLGRAAAYGEALDGGPVAVRVAVARNVYADASAGRASGLADYAMSAFNRLRRCPLEDYTAGTLVYPDPDLDAAEGPEPASSERSTSVMPR